MERSPEIVIGDFSSSNLDEDFRLNVLKPWVDRASADGVIFIFRGIDPSELPRVDGLLVVEGAQLSQLPSTRIAEHIESREGLARRLAAAIPRGLPASGSQPIVCADHVRAPYSKVDVTLSIAKGEILLLRGPNGSGKTSFGRSLVEERALPGLTMSPSASAGMALQNPEHMLFSATVERQANGDDNLIELCGIPTSDVTLQPLSLSRSKQKLLAIASACQVSGDLVILDEPTVGLDDIDYVRLGALIGHYPDKSFLIISHDSVVQSAAIQKGWKIHDVAEVI